MPFVIKSSQKLHLELVKKCDPTDVITLCKIAFDYLANGPENQREIYKAIAEKYDDQFKADEVQLAVEALISILIEATRAKATEGDVKKPLTLADFREDTVEILTQFLTSKRNFIEGSIKTANIRSYRLVNLEWRLEIRLASRTVMKQSQIVVVMKLYLHTEPKNENRDLLDTADGNSRIHEDERRNRKDILVQTDLNSLTHMIHNLEEALIESRTRRLRNIVEAIH